MSRIKEWDWLSKVKKEMAEYSVMLISENTIQHD